LCVTVGLSLRSGNDVISGDDDVTGCDVTVVDDVMWRLEGGDRGRAGGGSRDAGWWRVGKQGLWMVDIGSVQGVRSSTL